MTGWASTVPRFVSFSAAPYTQFPLFSYAEQFGHEQSLINWGFNLTKKINFYWEFGFT